MLERPRYRVRRRIYQALVDRVGPVPVPPHRISGSIPRWRYIALDIALRLFPKGSGDCRAHEWYVTVGGDLERCRYCQVGARVVEPEERDPWRYSVAKARLLMQVDEVFAALVDRVFHAADVDCPEDREAEVLLLGVWLRYSEALED